MKKKQRSANQIFRKKVSRFFLGVTILNFVKQRDLKLPLSYCETKSHRKTLLPECLF